MARAGSRESPDHLFNNSPTGRTDPSFDWWVRSEFIDKIPDRLVSNQVIAAGKKDQVVVGILWEFVLPCCAQSCQMQRMPRELDDYDTKKINYLQDSKFSD